MTAIASTSSTAANMPAERRYELRDKMRGHVYPHATPDAARDMARLYELVGADIVQLDAVDGADPVETVLETVDFARPRPNPPAPADEVPPENATTDDV